MTVCRYAPSTLLIEGTLISTLILTLSLTLNSDPKHNSNLKYKYIPKHNPIPSLSWGVPGGYITYCMAGYSRYPYVN